MRVVDTPSKGESCESDADFMSKLHQITGKDEKTYTKKSLKIAPVAAAMHKKDSHKGQKKMKLSRKLRTHPHFTQFAAALRNLRTNPMILKRASLDEKFRSELTDESFLKDYSLYKMLRETARGLLGHHEYDTWIAIAQSQTTSGVATANAPVFPTDPTASAEFGSFATLFDEMKMVAVKMFWRFSASVVLNNGTDIGHFYDPIDATAVAALTSVLTAEQHQGPIGIAPIPGANGSAPVCVNRTGHFEKVYKQPAEPQLNQVVSTCYTGQWADCNLANPNWGYVKFFAAGVAAGTTTISLHLLYSMKFRCRQ